MGPEPVPVDARVIRRRLRRLTSLAKGASVGVVAAVAVGATAAVATMVTLGRIVDVVLAGRHRIDRELTLAFLWLVALVLLRAACAGAVEWCGQRVAVRVKSRLRRSFVDAVFARGPRWNRGAREQTPESDRSGALVADAIDGVEKLDAYYRRYLPQAAAAAIAPPIVLATVAWFDPTSALILAITGPLLLVFMWLIGARAEARTRRQWRTLRRLSGMFLETLQGLPTSLAFGRARDAVDRLDASGEDYRVATMSVLRVAFLSGFVLELAATVSTALVAVGVGVRLIEGWIPFAAGFTVLLLTPELFAPLRQLGQRHHAGMEGVAAAERVFAWLDAPPAPISSLAQPAAAVANAMQVRFSNVSYRYPDAAHDALSNIDLELQPGTLTALVGPSGAGKSTLVDLLLRFAEPSVGAIHADGERIASFDPVLWRRRLAFVPQRPRFFDGSVIDNLRTGRPEASLETVRDAARRAEVDAFVSRLPRGYETGLGEMAARASVGERQRLALARALLREAPLLVLDEPTSSLDPLTERAITRVLAEESRRRTVLVVAHRLHTVRAADQLIVLEGGRAAETGRHDDLMRRGGAYARLVSALPRDLPAPIGGLTPGYSELDEVVT